MGMSQTKEKGGGGRASERVVEGLKEKVRQLQGERKEIMCMREREREVYEGELMVFAFKQAEWKRERKRLKEEAKKLKNQLLEQNHNHNHEHSSSISDQIKAAEQIRRDETLEKWKQLYFAIKVELDDLIQRTRQEERLCWRMEEEDVMLELKEELSAKEERIEFLQRKLASMENQQVKREREIDILRQSLRIMSHKRRASSSAPKNTEKKSSLQQNLIR